MCIWCVLHGKTLRDQKELPSCDSTFFLPDSLLEDGGATLENMCDWDTVSNLPEALQVAVPDRIVPLKTTGDGNCLLHAVSRAIWGVELYFEVLRVNVLEELTKNIEWYKKAAKEFNAEDWDRVIQNAAKTGAHLEFVHTLALSNVIKRPIILYASDSDMDRYGQGESGVAATFVPARVGTAACKQRPIILAWQTTVKNHYVPIVGISGRGDMEWPLLKAAFPEGIPEGDDVSDYMHMNADVVEPAVVKLLAEQKKEIQRRREEEKQLLAGLQDTLRRVMKAQEEEERGKKRSFLEEMDYEEKEKEDSDDDDELSVEEGDMGAYIAPPGSIIRTADGFIRVPNDRSYLLTYGKGGDKKHEEMVNKLKAKMAKRQKDKISQLNRLLSGGDEEEEEEEIPKKPTKIRYEGRDWDYVFPVKLEARGPVRYIACNKDDDLVEVAERFLMAEGISKQFLPKIVSFLRSNIEKDEGEKEREKKGSSRPPAPKGTRIPIHEPTAALYNTGQFDGILKKLSEFNSQFAANEKTKGLALTGEEGVLLKTTVDTLKAVSAYHTSSFALDEYRVIQKLLSWPAEKLFPVLDIIRLMVLHPKAAEHFRLEHAKGHNFLLVLLRMMQPSQTNNCLIVLKFLCNMFYGEELKALAEENCELIVKVCVPCIEIANPHIRLGLANLAVNYATQIKNMKLDTKLLLLTLLRELLNVESDPKALFSILAAVGTLFYDDWRATDCADRRLGMTALVEKHVSSSEEKVAECARDILNLVQWARGDKK